MLFTYNKYHHTVYSAAANEVTGKINQQYNNVEYYFHLKSVNDSLVAANEELYNRLKENYSIPDTLTKLQIDTMLVDSIKILRRYLFMEAKVIMNSVNQPNNYIQLHRGAMQAIQPDFGVIDMNNAVLGTVVDVSTNYSVVMSLLHEQSNLSARLKRSGETGTVVWDGIDPNILLLKDISKTVKIKAGDTIVTSGFSDKFPAGLLVGYVKDIINDKSMSTYTVRLTPGANFETVQHAYVIDNVQKQEPADLLKKVKK